jgi:hypothetical protein
MKTALGDRMCFPVAFFLALAVLLNGQNHTEPLILLITIEVGSA